MAAVLFAAMVVIVFLQVVSRIFFTPLTFTEEIARYLFLWLVYTGFSYGTKNKSHIRLEILTAKLKGARRAVFNTVHNVLTIATMGYLLYSSIRYIAFSWVIRSPTMGFSVGIIYVVAPLAFTATIARCVEAIAQDAGSVRRPDAAGRSAENTGSRAG